VSCAWRIGGQPCPHGGLFNSSRWCYRHTKVAGLEEKTPLTEIEKLLIGLLPLQPKPPPRWRPVGSFVDQWSNWPMDPREEELARMYSSLQAIGNMREVVAV
jgi:hypothetical protein